MTMRSAAALMARGMRKAAREKEALKRCSWDVLRGDTVEVLAGKERGVHAKVKRVFRSDNRVQLHNTNLVKRHVPKRVTGESTGRILTLESPMHASNVRPVDPSSNRGTRIRSYFSPSGARVRVSTRSGSAIARPAELAQRQTHRAPPGGRLDTPSHEVHKRTLQDDIVAAAGGDIPSTIPEWPGAGKDPAYRRKRTMEGRRPSNQR